ncbi:MAG TPA: hypothetical protein VFE12_13430, partial [Acetobacteraceae bacterium]|nr:hypothetical protein [Acetobacteraceae bacterium]
MNESRVCQSADIHSGRLAMRIIFALVLLAGLATTVQAARPAVPPVTNVLLTSDYEVAGDGTYTRVLHMER